MNKLRPKYSVSRLGDESIAFAEVGRLPDSVDPENVDSPFVLLPRKDPAAFEAMLTYVRYCEPELGTEILNWLREILKAEPGFGTQGCRNWRYMRLRSVQGSQVLIMK